MSEPGNTGPEPGSKASSDTAKKVSDTMSKARKGFTHPALQAMGIPRIRVPSRNWLIFWAVTGSVVGLAMYDRRERKKVRQQWKDRVSFLAQESMDPLSVPRKVTVYIAPPPQSYVDQTLLHFKHYIKPILTASATDFEVRQESRQGELRHLVAEEIRDQRRAAQGLPVSGVGSKDELDERIQKKLDYDLTGGVICVGRGAYKEYMHGLHEGWLGPLEPPADLLVEGEDGKMRVKGVDEAASKLPDRDEDLRDIYGLPPVKEEEQAEPAIKNTSDQVVQSLDTSLDDAEINEPEKPLEKVEEKKDEDEEEKKTKKPPVPMSYIELDKWSQVENTPQDFAHFVASNQIAEPMAAITYPHIMGFLNTPIRIWRFFNQRKLADEICREAAAVVFAQTRPAVPEDVDHCKLEEKDWPKKWVKEGVNKGSEWTRDLEIDERILGNMRIYELPAQLPTKDDSNSVDGFVKDL